MKLTNRQDEIFAILFASGEPMEITRLAEALEMPLGETMESIAQLEEALEEEKFPLQLRRLDDSCQLCSRAQYADIIRKALEIKKNIPLSNAAMEALAIIAYNQPVTRGFVEQVRGVDSSGVVASLADKGLVEEAGRLDLPGRPVAYRTTSNFLRCFGLNGLEQLPPVEDEPETGEIENPEEQITLEESLQAKVTQ